MTSSLHGWSSLVHFFIPWGGGGGGGGGGACIIVGSLGEKFIGLGWKHGFRRWFPQDSIPCAYNYVDEITVSF